MMRKCFVWLAVLSVLAAGISYADVEINWNSTSWMRYEINDNTMDFHDEESGWYDDDYEWGEYRIRLGIEAVLTDNYKAYVEGQFADFLGAAPQFYMNDADDFDLYQGYLLIHDLNDGMIDIKLGRQELVFGTEFLLGDMDFYQGQAFDGARVDFNFDRGWISLFDMKLEEQFAVAAADDTSLYGIYSSWDVMENTDFDAYILYYRNREDFAGSESTAKIYTPGLRFGRAPGETWDWNAEFAYQTGDVLGEVDHSGWAFEGKLGYTFDMTYTQRFGGILAWYSGDDDATDNDADYFFTYGQDYHGRYGNFDYLWSYWTANVAGTAYLGANIYGLDYWVRFNDQWDMGLALVGLWAAEDEFDTGLSTPVKIDDDLGYEVDIYFNYIANEFVTFYTNLSYLSPGDGIEDLWGYSMLNESADAAFRWYIGANIDW